MRRLRLCFLVPTIIALVLFPALATALPPDARVPSAAERPEATPGFFSQLWSLFSALWSQNGSILEPNGGATPGAPAESGTEPNDAESGDNGSILEPNG